MFAPKDQKAKFRIGAKVTYDYSGGTFKIVGKQWDANGALNYTIDDGTVTFFVRQSELIKA